MKYRNIVAALIVITGVAIIIAGNNNTVYNQRMNTATNLKITESRLQNMAADEILGNERIPELVTEIKSPAAEDQTRATKTGDTITVHYRGWLAQDGTVFDQSFNRNEPFTFALGGQVIQGWNEGIKGMKLGEVRRLKIPSDLAYGENGSGSIPENSDLIFDVELMEIR